MSLTAVLRRHDYDQREKKANDSIKDAVLKLGAKADNDNWVASPATIKKEKKDKKKQKRAAAKAEKDKTDKEALMALAANAPKETPNWCWFFNSKARGGPKDCKWGKECRRDHVRVPDAVFNAAPVPGSRSASPAPLKRSGSPPPEKPGGKAKGKGQESGKAKGKGKDERPRCTFEEKRIYYADPKNFRTDNGKKTVFFCTAYLNNKCERDKCFFPHRNQAKIDQLNAVLNA